MGLLNWLVHNGFDAFQTFAIVVSFGVTVYTLRRDYRIRRLANTFEINRQHRDLWLHFSERPELASILESSAGNKPISSAESEFVNLVILHLKLAHRAIQDRLYDAPEGLAVDIREFFRKPIPRRVWEERKPFYGTEFVSFVEKYF